MEPGQENLVLLQIVMRHGEKGEGGKGPTGFASAMLTDRGKQSLEDLGRYVKQRYAHLLTNDLSEFSAKSSEVVRCVDSAATFLTGAYPQLKSEKIEHLRNKIETKPMAVDPVLFPGFHFPEADEELQEAAKDDYEFRKKHRHTIAGLNAIRIDTINRFAHFRDHLLYLKQTNSVLPERMTPELEEGIEQLAKEIPLKYFDREKLKIFRTSSLLKTILNNMLDVSKGGKRDKKFFVFCTHDILLIFLALALQSYDQVLPLFCESYVFELYETNSDYAVAIHRIRPTAKNGIEPPVKIYPKGEEKHRAITLLMKDFEPYFQYVLKETDLTGAKPVWNDIPLCWDEVSE